MRCRLFFAIALLVVGTRLAIVHADDPAPFDRLAKAYAPYLDADDPLGWPAKAWSLSASEYKFWRGSKDLFYRWCNEHCTDWRDDTASYVPAHGDLHQGNIGTYATSDGFGELAFGMVDFDDSTRLPFQIELLQGFITLRLMARESGIALEPAAAEKLDACLIDAYRAAILSDQNATVLLAGEPRIARMLAASQKVMYAEELAKFCDGDSFRNIVKNKKGEITDTLRSLDATEFDGFAAALAEACANDDAMAHRMQAVTTEYVRRRIKAVAERTRLGSSGSQGLKKYLVLLDRPFAGVDSDLILYFKQEIPTSAERSGFVSTESRSQGERAKRSMDELVSPGPLLNSYATMNGRSFWVSLKEPWSDELPDRVANAEELFEAARVWGTVAGASIRVPEHRRRVLSQLDGTLEALSTRADRYLRVQHASYLDFAADPRVGVLKDQVDRLVATLRAK